MWTWPLLKAQSATRRLREDPALARVHAPAGCLGDCAVTGNVPAMRNSIPVKKLLERIYIQGVDEKPRIPTEGVPPLLKRATPLNEVVKVDLFVPGCPPPAAAIGYVLGELLNGRTPDLNSKVKFG